MENNFRTPNTRIQHFRDYIYNKDAEKKELENIKRSFLGPDEESSKSATIKKYKYNKVTHKIEDDSLEEIKDDIENNENVEQIKESIILKKFKDV